MKIFCIGRNYVDHAKELNNPVPSKPLIFMKPPTAILASGKDFYIPEFTKDVHYEVEVVIKICKNGKYIAKRFASDYYKELSLGIDITARDVQTELKAKGHPWEIAKGFDNSAVLGKFIPKSKVDINNLNFSLHKNGELAQKGNVADMIFTLDDIIVYLSQFYRLQMGDLIYTGTPAGVGPMTIGDHFEGFVEEKKVFDTRIK